MTPLKLSLLFLVIIVEFISIEGYKEQVFQHLNLISIRYFLIMASFHFRHILSSFIYLTLFAHIHHYTNSFFHIQKKATHYIAAVVEFQPEGNFINNTGPGIISKNLVHYLDYIYNASSNVRAYYKNIYFSSF
jgi:hypothetical protein